MDDREALLRSLYHLVGKMYLYRAGTGGPTPGEWCLIDDLCDWYRTTGKPLAESRRVK